MTKVRTLSFTSEAYLMLPLTLRVSVKQYAENVQQRLSHTEILIYTGVEVKVFMTI